MRRKPLLEILLHQYPDRSREELYSAILCREVSSPMGRHTDPKELVSPTLELSINREKYVSRGGYKLETVLLKWNIPVRDRIWLDAGASTGGFTDCLLQHGAAGVHAVDVGYNQLAWSLRSDPRVFVHEQTNIGEIYDLDPVPHAAVADLSFRSLRGILKRILDLTSEKRGIALFKPQFELAHDIKWGKRDTDFAGGIVRDGELQSDLFLSVRRELLEEGVEIERILPSPITGKRGNQEYLILVRLWSSTP